MMLPASLIPPQSVSAPQRSTRHTDAKEQPAPNAVGNDTATQDAATPPDAATPDAATPDAATPDAATPDAATQHAATQHAATQHAATQHAATQDAATQDTATQHAATQHAATEHTATPLDTVTPDFEVVVNLKSLEALTIRELREMCEERQLNPNGRKKELIARLQ